MIDRQIEKIEWKYFLNKKVFIKTKTERQYTGIVLDVNDSDKPIIFVTIRDKKNNIIMFVTSEIVFVEEMQ